MRSVLVSTSLLLVCLALPVASQPNDGFEVQGLRGTLPRQAAQQVLGARMDDFVACVTTRRARNELIGGATRLDLVIALDGSVRVARLLTSDLGDRDSERCLLRIAGALRFPAPTGGEANVQDTLRFPLDADVRPGLSWRAERVTASASAALARIPARCRMGAGAVQVTAYVGPGGELLTAGAYATAPELDAKLDCVLGAVADLDFPEPGSYPAKVSFEVVGR